MLGLPATQQNLTAVQGVLDKINVRTHTLKELNVNDMSKQELKSYILYQLGQPEQSKVKLNIELAVDELFLEHMKYLELVLRRSKSTLSNYQTAYNIITNLNTKILSDVKNILEELSQLEYAVYYQTLLKLSVCCNWAIEENKIHKNPFLSVIKALKEPRPSDEHPDPFSRQAMERIIEAYRSHPYYHRYADLVEFYFLTGLRTGEAIALLWSDIDFERGLIYIRKTIAIVRGKHDPRNETKTGKDREFPIEDPALERLLRRLSSLNKNPDGFVFQEPTGLHINRKSFYNSWHENRIVRILKSGVQKEYFTAGIVSKLAALGEEHGGIDHYRPQYNTRHTFISLAVEGRIELNESTMREIMDLAAYVGNTADIILKHYLGRSNKREIVVISCSSEDSRAFNEVKGENLKDEVIQTQQIINLEQQNSQLKTALQSIVQLVDTVLLQYVPETLRLQLSAFVTTLVSTHLPNFAPSKSESSNLVDEDIAKCVAWLTLESDSDT